MFLKTSLGSLLSLFLFINTYAENIVYPPNAGVIDVTKPPYNADRTGATDATAAIQQAMDAYPNGNRIIYLPNGTYLVSNTIKWPPSASVSCGTCQKRTTLQGQSRDGTIIRLKDNCAGFQDTASRKGVLWTGATPAQRFRNSIWNLTVNIGKGNPSVSAIQYNTSNQGSIRHVKLISEDRAGVAGLDVGYVNEIGPGFIDDLEVIGFDKGIVAYTLNSLTFRNIKLSNQRKCGFDNYNHVVSIEGFTSTNSVPAVKNTGVMMLLDATLSGSGAASTIAAITNNGDLYARTIKTSGYARAIDNSKGTKQGAIGPTVTEFVSHAILSQFPSPQTSQHLPRKQPPSIPFDTISDWVSPMDFGGVGNGTADDTKALQDAIDAGKHNVYLPAGKQFKFTEIIIRGKVRKFVGCQGSLWNGLIRFGSGSEPVVAFENIDAIYHDITLRHESTRTLIVRNCTAVKLVGAATGEFYIEDVCASPFLFETPGQRIWAWQLNPEGATATNIVNKGAYLWLMGLKTEQAATKLATSDGGFTEVLGGHIYAQGAQKTTPLFTIDNASASFAAVRQISFANTYYTDVVKETRNGIAKTLTLSNSGVTLQLYTGYLSTTAASHNQNILSPFAQVKKAKPFVSLMSNRNDLPSAGFYIQSNRKIRTDVSSISGRTLRSIKR